MKDDNRSKILPEARDHYLTPWELRESIRRFGVRQPALLHRGDVLDGRRRMLCCQGLGIQCPKISLDRTLDAARELWLRHPRRAYQRFAPPGRPRRATLAVLFGCNIREIPTAQQAVDQLRQRERRAAMSSLPRIELPRSELQRAHAAARHRGITLTSAIRGLVAYLASESPDPDGQSTG